MIRAMFSGVSGLRAHQTQMDVIGNNISNVNTVGFKSSTVLFKDVYYQTITGASAANATTGGLNPSQIGYGTTVASINVQNTRGGMLTTDNAMDQYISGEGYFIIQNGAGDISYSRVGAFTFDKDGNLVDSNGGFVCGANAALPSPVVSVVPIKVANISNYSNISISSDGTITGIDNTDSSVDVLGQIALAKFVNESGLTEEGNSYYKESANSGAPTYTEPGSNLSGTLVSGALEMSNVDLSKELTNMIIAERGFQANSRVITTSDEILQELVNLKR